VLDKWELCSYSERIRRGSIEKAERSLWIDCNAGQIKGRKLLTKEGERRKFEWISREAIGVVKKGRRGDKWDIGG
jgi:hypothetical protein